VRAVAVAVAGSGAGSALWPFARLGCRAGVFGQRRARVPAGAARVVV